MKTEVTDPRSAAYQRPTALQKKIDAVGVVEGCCQGQSYPVAIVVGRWHQFIADPLLQGALQALSESGIDDDAIDIVYAPGSYEIPLVAKRLADLGRYKAIVTLGAIIKGDTPHFDFVAGECARGIADVSLEYDIPISFGVLTVNTVEQALVRAAVGEANKGREAALAAVEMVALLSRLN